MNLVPHQDREIDFRAFQDTVAGCFSDKRIISYFEQGVVTPKQASQVLNVSAIFDEATRLNSYQIYSDLREQQRGSSNLIASLVSRTDLPMARQGWLDDSTEKVIIPNIILAINTILGDYQDKLLIEHGSEGLRRLQDPTFRVPTRTREKLTGLLSQMDGGSVAIAGPRGAGKSTLLKQFCQPLDSGIRSARTIAVYAPAPSNYVARDFIAELFQRLCESYLSYCDYPPTEELYNIGSSRIRRQRTTHKVLRILWLTMRAAIAITLIIVVIWPLATHKGFATGSNFPFGHQLADKTVKSIRGWWDNYRAYFLLVILLVALEIWPPKRAWRIRLRRNREPELIRRAREYLLRLQIDKTVTRGAGVSAPNVRGLGFTMNRSSSTKYTPWSLPELVSYTRRFMQDVSSSMKGAKRPVVVAIDEIDRIGSLDEAEGFIGEIKAVFGVEGCYFLVAVAEDVGSLFAQRATAGRSILENAFDEIVAVGPLTLQEARSLLLKRVPGFTDAFVYLVHAMSGGLPRELIRVTRRLDEMNHERLSQLENPKPEDYPPLTDLSHDLVIESMVEALDASRNQMSQLLLQSDWAALFDYVRTAGITLRRDRALPSKLYEVMKEIAELKLPDSMKNEDTSHATAEADDYVAAARILNSLSAFAYFGITVIDAFSDKYFNLTEGKRRADTGADDAYEELAAARIELGVSYASARLILDRFRASLQSALAEYRTIGILREDRLIAMTAVDTKAKFISASRR